MSVLPSTMTLGSTLEIPHDFVTRRVATLGMSGSGKSNALAVMIEQTHRIGGVFVAFDPLGTLWGLRAAADGLGPGLPIPIFGGYHADVPIAATRGALLARELFDANASALVDLSAFEGDERCTFVTDFVRERMRLHARAKKPLALFVDEVHLLAPETPQSSAENRCELALADLHTGGRGLGIGLKTATQSAAEQSKRTLKQAELVIAMRTFSPLDQRQIKAYLGAATTADHAREVLATLARLKDGEAWFVSPHWLGRIERHRFALRATFDSSRTPEVGETIVEPKTFAPVDLERLRAVMQADDVAGETVVDDVAVGSADARVRAQAREIATLRTLLAAANARITVADGRADALASQLARIAAIVTERGTDQDNVNATTPVIRVVDDVRDTSASEATDARMARRPRAASRARTRAAAIPSRDDAMGDVGGPSAAALLRALAIFPTGTLTRPRLAAVSGVSARKSTFRLALGALRARGLVETPDEDVVLTAAGRRLIGSNPPAATVEDRLAMWRGKLTSRAAAAVFDTLIATHPTPLPRDTIAAKAGVRNDASTFRLALGALRALGLVEESEHGLSANPDLFASPT